MSSQWAMMLSSRLAWRAGSFLRVLSSMAMISSAVLPNIRRTWASHAARSKAPDLARLQREAAEFFRETFLGNPLTLSPSGVCGRHLGRDPLGLQKR